MRRFLIPTGFIGAGSATIRGDVFRHMAKVLRLKAGDSVLLVDGTGREFTGVIQVIGKESLVVDLLDTGRAPDVENSPAITLYQGLPKGDKMDLIIQKATELGIAEVIPFRADRSVPRIRPGEENGKVARWQRIAVEAARQSGRASFPGITIAGALEDALDRADHDVKLLLWEGERENRLKQILAGLSTPGTVAMVVGPEGGLTGDEADKARAAGFIPVSLGKRIVRTETASLVMLAILQFYWGDLG